MNYSNGCIIMKKQLAIFISTLCFFSQLYCNAQNLTSDTLYSVFINVLYDEAEEPIPEAEVRVEGSDGTILETHTDSKGFCSFSNLSGRNIYSVIITAHGCFTEKYKIKQFDSCVMNSVIDFRLVPMTVKSTFLPIFTFKKGSLKLLNNSPDDISIISQIMRENPSFTISISGHCDPRERKALAKKRAELIYQLLLQSGIDSNRFIIDSLCIKQSVIRHSYQGCREVPNTLFVSKSFLRRLPKEQRLSIKKECREVRIKIASANYSPQERN